MTELSTTQDSDPGLDSELYRDGPIESVLQSPNIEVLTGRSNPTLARGAADRLRLKLDEPVTLFADGEAHVKISQNLRRKEVYIIQSTSANPEAQFGPMSQNDAIMELMFMIRAAKRASAQEVTAVLPYYGYARQDRKDQPRVTIAGADVASMIVEAGADRIVTVDIHSEQQQGFTKIPWDNIYASPALLSRIRQNGTDNMTVVSPDVGGTKRAEKIAMLLGFGGDIAIVHKVRDKANQSRALAVIGDVVGKDVLLFDDILDTGGTIANAAQLVIDRGARSAQVAITHGLFNGKAMDRIANSPITRVYVTDTVATPINVRNHPKVITCSVAPLLAEVIRRIHTGESLSALIPTSNNHK